MFKYGSNCMDNGIVWFYSIINSLYSLYRMGSSHNTPPPL